MPRQICMMETMVQDADASNSQQRSWQAIHINWRRILLYQMASRSKNLAGTLDGQGHTITLSGSALAVNVSGTIQNLGREVLLYLRILKENRILLPEHYVTAILL